MPRPHTHPSLTCYKTHGCRCDACKKLAAEAQRITRSNARQRAGRPYVGVKAADLVGRARPLDGEEVVRLRRLVGLPDEGPPPDPRGRPRKATRQSAS